MCCLNLSEFPLLSPKNVCITSLLVQYSIISLLLAYQTISNLDHEAVDAGWKAALSGIHANHKPWECAKIVIYVYHWVYFLNLGDLFMGLLPDTWNCGLRMHRECRERDARAVMHAGIAK